MGQFTASLGTSCQGGRLHHIRHYQTHKTSGIDALTSSITSIAVDRGCHWAPQNDIRTTFEGEPAISWAQFLDPSRLQSSGEILQHEEGQHLQGTQVLNALDLKIAEMPRAGSSSSTCFAVCSWLIQMWQHVAAMLLASSHD